MSNIPGKKMPDADGLRRAKEGPISDNHQDGDIHIPSLNGPQGGNETPPIDNTAESAEAAAKPNGATSLNGGDPPLSPRQMDALQFLSVLGAEVCTFQTFDDDADRKKQNIEEIGRDPYAKILHGTLQQHWKKLCALNAQGVGIFVTVNATDTRPRGDSAFTAAIYPT